mmetsp:Transcript_13276/g.15251  ORF Transcript_13276/g.15251 Transcript_13276/m.15251 type:complete len:90 (-) Transcript_13276:352-621(-)
MSGFHKHNKKLDKIYHFHVKIPAWMYGEHHQFSLKNYLSPFLWENMHHGVKTVHKFDTKKVAILIYSSAFFKNILICAHKNSPSFNLNT